MRRPRVLVVYKKSAYQVYAVERKEKKVRALLRQNTASTRILMDAHDQHEASLRRVMDSCAAAGVDVHPVYRAHMRRVTNVDLVVTVGGDGTLLDASHKVDGVPMLGVNSNPARSVGFLTGVNADTFPNVLNAILDGKMKPLELLRLDVAVNGKSARVPVLNDVLYCHVNPAATSRYTLARGKKREEQKSSGIWIATPAGSTAAILSAGGFAEPLTARRFQFRVREPYAPPGHSLKIIQGFIKPPAPLEFENFMREGALYLDGNHIRVRVGMGDKISITAHPEPLMVYRPAR